MKKLLLLCALIGAQTTQSVWIHNTENTEIQGAGVYGPNLLHRKPSLTLKQDDIQFLPKVSGGVPIVAVYISSPTKKFTPYYIDLKEFLSVNEPDSTIIVIDKETIKKYGVKTEQKKGDRTSFGKGLRLSKEDVEKIHKR